MAAPKGPTSRRVHLGKILAQMREERGERIPDVAQALGFSELKMWRFETGRTSLPNPGDLKKLLEHYGVNDLETVDKLLEIHRESLREGWWVPYNPHFQKGMRDYVGLETDATEISAWHPNLIFGLCQTESYARALIESAKSVDETTTEFIETNIELRMKRKQIITVDDPRKLWVIMGEAALRDTIGGPEIMREQLEEILRLANLDHITIQILPSASKGYRVSQNFIILTMEEPLPTMVQADHVNGQAWVTDKRPDVWKFSRRLEALRAAALPPAETPHLIHQLAREIEPSTHT